MRAGDSGSEHDVDEGRDESLNEISAEVLGQLRSLGSLDRHLLLYSRIRSEDRGFVDAFLADVVDGNQDPREWGRTGLLVPNISLADLLRSSSAAVLQPLYDLDRGEWTAVSATQRAWDSANEHTGAPARFRADLSYGWKAPAGTARIWRTEQPDEDGSDPKTRLRRWTASRLARAALADGVAPRTMLKNLGLDEGDLSIDARIALDGLVSEGEDGARDGVPGFRGPDSAYQAR